MFFIHPQVCLVYIIIVPQIQVQWVTPFQLPIKKVNNYFHPSICKSLINLVLERLQFKIWEKFTLKLYFTFKWNEIWDLTN